MGLAVRRSMLLKRHLEKDPELKERYIAPPEDHASKGYAEVVPEGEQTKTTGAVWVLPHRGVYKHGDSNGVKAVCGCAGVFGNHSLTKQLPTCPNLVDGLCGVSSRFWPCDCKPVTDIKAAFLQVKVSVSDHDCLRFPWWSDGVLTSNPRTHRSNPHHFGTNSPHSCSSLALRTTVERNMTNYDTAVINLAKGSFYVDDCLMSVSSTEDVEKLGGILREALLMGGLPRAEGKEATGTNLPRNFSPLTRDCTLVKMSVKNCNRYH
ncbi:unnamed protein product [Echinostoma caproni]|uniref:Reverse transcriptase domain-containing protein n=1 Tax=Echinostoma caproni TaxID=27848 RepID=A0A183A1C9_9TREM|nr:unnamed protein product [Echinostoma caproni]